MKLTIKKYNPLAIAMCIMIILNIIAHYVRFVFGNVAIITRIEQLCWLILFVFWVLNNSKKRIKISGKVYIFFSILVVSTILGWLIGSEIYLEVKEHFVQMFFFIISFALCVCMKWSEKLRIRDINLIIKCINMCSIVAVVYGMFFQNDLILRVLKNDNAAKASWNYFSFFHKEIFLLLYVL